MDSPNRMAIEIVDEAIDFADEFGIGIHHLANDAVCLDFGINTTPGIEAGLLLAEIATAGLATVQTRVDTIADVPITHVELATDHPAIGLLSCQYPGWILHEDHGPRASGPAQLLSNIDPFELGFGDDFDLTSVIVESETLPTPELAEVVANRTSVPTSGVYLLAVPVDSLAATVWTASLAALTALTWLAELDCDPTAVTSVTASAPIVPLPADSESARARLQTGLATGSQAHLFTTDDISEFPDRFSTSAEQTPNPPRADHAIVEIDNISPAAVTIDVLRGPEYSAGSIDEANLRRQLGL